MRKVYLLGGESILQRDAQDVNEQAFSDAGGAPNVLVFSWARASFDKSFHRQRAVFNYFRFLGASNISTVDYSSSPEEINEKISQSDLIYLTGGSPSILIERLKNTGVDCLLDGFEGIIVGRSAGALALCKKCVVTIRPYKKVKVIEGLGLLDLTLKAHYELGRDETLMALSLEEKIFAVPKGSALICSNGAYSFINNVYLFEGGKRKELNHNAGQ